MQNLFDQFSLNIKLAYRNIIGAGLRTWLNVGILSFAFVVILLLNGIMDGWQQQAVGENIAWAFGHGQVVHPKYDPQDPFSLQQGHGALTPNPNLTPILLQQGNIYPKQRMLPVVIKGIDVQQQTLSIPTEVLAKSDANIPALIGRYMANTNNLKVGDRMLMRWKDKNGAFDAQYITIAGIFDTDVPTVDIGQIWVPIRKLWTLTGLQNHATYQVANAQYQPETDQKWHYKSQDDLLADTYQMIEQEKSTSAFSYIILLAIALIAIFDAQVFSVFKRQKEIGTYIALGFTRKRVTALFTLEGIMYAVLACIVGSLYSYPIFQYFAKEGIAFGKEEMTYEMGITMGEKVYPYVSASLILTTFLVVVGLACIVSYLPVRKIATMNPVDALKGKKS